jgi:hypothetical protein
MTRSGSFILLATLGGGLLACGSNNSKSPTDPLDLVPLDQAVSGWTVDQAKNKQPGERAMTAATETQAGALIDGGFENYYQEPNIPKMFLYQNYTNSTLAAAPEGATLRLYIFEMSSVDQAKGIYTAILQRPNYSTRAGMEGDWAPTEPIVGTESRFQDTGSQWWINFHQDVFYVELLLDPSAGPAPDFTPGNTDTKQESVRFAQAIASKI